MAMADAVNAGVPHACALALGEPKWWVSIGEDSSESLRLMPDHPSLARLAMLRAPAVPTEEVYAPVIGTAHRQVGSSRRVLVPGVSDKPSMPQRCW